MDVNHVTPFIEGFSFVMPQLGFAEVARGALGAKPQHITCSGVIIIVGIVGVVKGNVVYNLELENAKRIASTMMMGMPVPELDDMAKSALSELANMLAANACTAFSKQDMLIDISTPTLLVGDNISVQMSMKQALCIQMLADGTPMEISVAVE